MVAVVGLLAFVAFGALIAWAWRYAGAHSAPADAPSSDASGGWRNMHDGGW